MNAFIKYLGKRIAEVQELEVIKEDEYLERVEAALVSIVGARIFIADAEVLGIVKKIEEE